MDKKNLIITRYVNNIHNEVEDVVIEEKPLTIFIDNEQFITLLSTPHHHRELAIGFILSEGLITNIDDIKEIDIDNKQSIAYVNLKNQSDLTKRLYGKRTITSGCGKGSIFYNVLDSLKKQTITTEVIYDVENITDLMNQMQKDSTLYRETGGVHSASLADNNRIYYTREDIGRHNAVDKVLGRALEDGVDIGNKMLLTSGRLSSEIVLKVLKAQIPILVSRSAPSSLAVELARENGLTLCGFVRGKKLNCYSHPERLRGGVIL